MFCLSAMNCFPFLVNDELFPFFLSKMICFSPAENARPNIFYLRDKRCGIEVRGQQGAEKYVQDVEHYVDVLLINHVSVFYIGT